VHVLKNLRRNYCSCLINNFVSFPWWLWQCINVTYFVIRPFDPADTTLYLFYLVKMITYFLILTVSPKYCLVIHHIHALSSQNKIRCSKRLNCGDNSLKDIGYYVLTRFRGVTIDGVCTAEWIYWPLGTTSNYRTIADLHTLKITTAPVKPFFSLLCLHQPFPRNGF
jgi:hypothetical protein